MFSLVNTPGGTSDRTDGPVPGPAALTDVTSSSTPAAGPPRGPGELLALPTVSVDGSWAQAERWVAAAVAGDATAIGQIVRLTQADVWRFVAALAGRHEADDLTQETYLRALRALGGFEGRSGLRTWLLIIARRTVVDHLRRQSVRPRSADLDDWIEPAERAAARSRPGGRSSGAATEIADLLDRLAPDRREALVLTQLVGLGYAEAADVIGCPVGTVRSRVARGREQLAALLAGSEGLDGPSAAAR